MKTIFRVRHNYSTIKLCLGIIAMIFTQSAQASQPTLSRVYSNRFTPQVQQYNNAGLLGTLNPDYGTNGNNNLGITFYAGYQTKAITTLQNGSMFVVLDGGSNTGNSLIALYNALGVIQNSFNSPYAYVTLSGYTGVNCSALDNQGRLLVGGANGSSGGGWLLRMDPANPTDYQLFAGQTNSVGAIGQQTSGRYIASGQSMTNNSAAYANIVGYNNDGSIDTTFGNNGQILFDGSISNGSGGYLSSSQGLLNLAIDQNDNIYVCYVDATTQQANLVRFDKNGVVQDFRAAVLSDNDGHNQILNNQIYINLDASTPYQDIIVAGTLDITPSTIALFGCSALDFTGISIVSGATVASSNALQVVGIAALQNNCFVVMSNDTTNNNVRVNQFKQNSFGPDYNFNPQAITPGYLEFQIASNNSMIAGGAVGVDGQLYLASYIVNETSNPYISKIYDYQYDAQVPQYPLAQLQGNFDATFGAPNSPQGTVRKQEFAGVDFLYNGSFGQTLNQQTVGIFELPSRQLLVGSYGLVQSNNNSTMMFTWLYPDGTFANQQSLTNVTGQYEEMDGFAVGGSGTIYVAGGWYEGENGYGYLRAYDSSGTQQWVNSPNEPIESWGLAVAVQGTDGILLSVEDADWGKGHLSRYTSDAGILDTTFGPYAEGSSGPQTGHILTNTYGLNMGPVWNSPLVRANDNAIFIAYFSSNQDGETLYGTVNVAGILRDGTQLLPGFGTNGIALNVFNFEDDANIGPLNLAFAFDNQNNIIVALSNYEDGLLAVTRIDSNTGNIDPQFNNGQILYLSINGDDGSLYISNVIGMSNGKFMLTGTNYSNENPLMFIARITDEGALDTTFNPASETPGILQFQVQDEENVNFRDRELTGLAIQSGSANLGNIVCSTYEFLQYNPDIATPEAMRIYGQPRTTQVQRFPTQDEYPGTLDPSLNNSGGFDLGGFLGDFNNGAGKVIYSYPAESPYDGMLLVGMDIDDSVQIVRFNASSLTLDPTFGDNGVYIVPNLQGINSIIVDKLGRIVSCGTMISQDSSQGWAFYCDKDGQNEAVFFAMPTTVVAANIIYQQKSGRFIIAGAYQGDSDAPIGTLIAFQDRLVSGATMLAVDTTFNILATTNAPQGQFHMPTTVGLYNLVVNSDDTMYIAYQDSSNLQGVNNNQYGVSISQILADGSRFDQGFYYGNVSLPTTLIPDNAQVISCVTDADQNIIVAISANNTLQLMRYTFNGGSNLFAPTQGSVPSLTATYLGASNVLIVPSPLMGTAGVALTDMLPTNSLLDSALNGIILLGTNTANGNLMNYGNLFAVRLTPTGDLDATWNPYSGYPTTSPNVPGVLTFGEAFVDATTSVVTPAVLQWNGVIDIGGNLWTAAVSNNGSHNYPTLIEIVGYQYLQAISQTQIAGASGIQDPTIWDNTNYVSTSLLNLTNLDYNNIMSNLYINQITGELIIGATSYNNVSLTTIDAPLNNNASINFNVSRAARESAVINDMFVANGYAQNGAILSTGRINDSMWSAVNATVLPTVPHWTSGNAIRQAVNGDTLVAGFDNDSSLNDGSGAGAIVAFLPNNLQIDPLFGNATPTNGIYTTDSSWPIAAMVVDNYSRIYIAYKISQQNGTLVRVLENGSGLDSSFTPVTFSNCDESQIALALDQDNNQIVIASFFQGNIYISRSSTIDGSATGSATMHVDDTLRLLDLSINTDQQIYCVASSSEGTNTVVARFNAISATVIAPDQSYAVEGGTPGIASVNLGMQPVAGALDPDRRVYVIGNNSETPYLARLFGNNYYLSVSQANEGVVLGDLDYSYGYDGITQTFAGGATVGQIASTILPITTGSDILVTVLSSGSDLESGLGTWTVRLLPDGTPDSTYGNGQGVLVGALPGFEFTRNMIFDGVSNAVSCGVNTDSEIPVGFIKNILPSGAMNTAFGGLNGDPAGTVYLPELFTINAVAQLSNGTYVFVGTDNTGYNGVLGMIDATGSLVTRFGSNGLVAIGNTLSSVSVDAENNIYVAGGDSESNAFVAKFNAVGKPVRSFGSNGVASNVLTNLNNIEDIIYIEMVLDVVGNIVVAGSVYGDTGFINVARLTPSGAIDTTFAPNSSNILSIPFNQNVAFPTSLIALTNNNYLVAGFDFTNEFEDSSAFIAAITSSGALDINFSPLSATPGIGFYDDFVVANPHATDALNISVQTNGQILLAGCDELVDTPYFIPITMRINGYPNTHAIRQFPPLATVAPNGLNKQFGDQGLCVTGLIDNLINGGSNAVDSQGRIVISGITNDYQLVVARFTPLGALDTTFNAIGINSVQIELLNINGNSYIALDSNDNVYVGGYLASNQLVVAKFLGSDGSLDNSYGSNGYAASDNISNLNYGGYLAIDQELRAVVAGQTTDFKLVAARFTSDGQTDETFNDDVATTGVISELLTGGFIAVDATSAVYLGGSTVGNQLLVAKFTNTGELDTTFNDTGIATTSAISGFINGGPIALDSNLNIVVGGYTSNKQFVAARFTPAGNLDSIFNGGIAYSSALNDLSGCAGLCIDSNNNILIGGTSVASDDLSTSIVVACITPLGQINTTFSALGVATSGPIYGLAVDSGFVAVNQLSNPIVGGFDSLTPQLVIGEFYSGSEIFVNHPSRLSAASYKIYWYGNNPALFKDFFGIPVLVAKTISNGAVQAAVTAAVESSLTDYADYVISGPNQGLILAASTIPLWDGNFSKLLALLIVAYPESSSDITEFFAQFNARRLAIYNTMLSGINQ